MRALALTVGMVLALTAGAAPTKRGTRRFSDDDRPKPLLRILTQPSGVLTTGDLTTMSGDPVTLTRPSIWGCQDSSGAIRSLAANKPCVVDGASLRVRGAKVRLTSHPTALDNAAWGSVGTPVVTAGTWDSGLGSLTGVTIADDDGVSSEGRAQSFTTTTTGPYTLACSMRSDTITTARLVVTVGGGTGTATCAVSGLGSTTSRQTCTITAAGAVTSITPSVLVGASGPDTGSIKVDACELTPSSQPGDLCLVGPTLQNQTCAAETATVATPAGLSRTEGSAKVCLTPSWTGGAPASARVLDGNVGSDTARFVYITGASTLNVSAYAGGSVASVAAGFTSGVEACYRTEWSAASNFLRIRNLTTGAVSSDVAFSTFPAFDATLGLGGNTSGSQQVNGNIRVALCKTSGGCQ